MKKTFVLIGILALALLWTGAGMAAESDTADHDVTITVSEVALINTVGADPSFTIGNPDGDIGGGIPDIAKLNESAKWLQYTSIAASGETRKVTVSIDDADNIPPGTILTVASAAPAGGAGTLGSAAGSPIDLADYVGATTADLLTGIGTGWTGTGGSDGANLTYDLAFDGDPDPSDLVAGDSYTVEVTYTLTEGS